MLMKQAGRQRPNWALGAARNVLHAAGGILWVSHPTTPGEETVTATAKKKSVTFWEKERGIFRQFRTSHFSLVGAGPSLCQQFGDGCLFFLSLNYS